MTTGNINLKADYLFEVSSEVINKVGGIFTVIRSKAHVTVEEYGKQYFLVGPYNEYQYRGELEDCTPEQPEIQRALDAVRAGGIKVKTGKLDIRGSPCVILFDVPSASHYLRDYRRDFLRNTLIDVPWLDSEVNDALIFGYLTAQFFQQLCFQFVRVPKIVAHFHEWISSIGLILCRQRDTDVATIFTTHATLLGRHMSAGQVNLQHVKHYHFDCDREAVNRGFYYRYCIEKLATNVAHIFTTVSKTTAEETQCFLGRYPDLVTPNGMNCDESTEDLQTRHRLAKDKIHDFVRGHFHGHLTFDLGKTLYMFLAGRYEYYNKGCDFFIEALARLNYRLQCQNSDVTVVAFVIMPAATHGYNRASLQGQTVRKQLQKAAEQLRDIFPQAMVNSCLRGKIPHLEDLNDNEEMEYLKSCIKNIAPDTLPPICTHNMADDKFDPVLNEMRRCRLFNSETDRVKIIFHPQFLSPESPVLPMDYDEFVHGCNLGVFPSSYEPWGYTPAECAVIGVPSVTTNLSGFGCFIADYVPNPDDYGIFIIDRKNLNIEQGVEQLTVYLHFFTQQTQMERGEQRRKTELLRNVLDWKTLGIAYVKARSAALQLTFKDEPESLPKLHEIPVQQAVVQTQSKQSPLVVMQERERRSRFRRKSRKL